MKNAQQPLAARRRKFWGWGYEDEQPPPEDFRNAVAGVQQHLGFGDGRAEAPVELEGVELPEPRLRPPPALASICTNGKHERAAHSYGKSYRDVVRAFRGRFEHVPDVIGFPRSEEEVEALLEWCGVQGAAAIPYGGGTSVVGGVEPIVDDRYEGVVTIDLAQLDRVLEIDEVSRAARVQAGATGPGLEDQLRDHGLTLRHFPQSFELSTLGGWIATRSAGHFATLYTHIDELVESLRTITPSGVMESRRLPGSGAGPSPDRLMIGSEGSLGIITEAWVRLQRRPRFKSSAGVRFDDFAAGAEAVRALSQSGLYPTNCRLLDPEEAALTGAVPAQDPSPSSRPPPKRASRKRDALLILGFESADHPVDAWMERGLECCADYGGRTTAERRGTRGRASGGASGGSDAVGSWRQAFLRAPYLRDVFVAAGILSETFETAVTWDRFSDFHANVMEATASALRELCGGGKLTCRFTHVYPDGPAPYFTILAPVRRGSELEQWGEIKSAASEAVLAA